MKDILVFLTEIALIAIAIALVVHHADQASIHDRTSDFDPIITQEGHLYPEVSYMLSNDSIMDIHHFWGIETIDDYDWVESAFSLGVPTSCLTVEMYMDHLQHGAASKYVRNHY